MSDGGTNDRAEAAAIRRRWITLGEFVAVAGLLLSAMALWMSWSDRQADLHERRAEKASESKAHAMVMLTGTPRDAGKRLALADAAHALQGVEIVFPGALGLAPVSASIDPAIVAGPLAGPILTMTANGPDEREGRLPVLITASYWDGDTRQSDTALYDVVWQREGKFFSGHTLRLKGLILVSRKGATKAALDARWAKVAPQGK